MKLKVKSRDLAGKKVRKIREEGNIPASVYGPKTDPINVSVDRKAFSKLLDKVGFSNLVDLTIDDKDAGKVLVKDVHFHPVTHEMLNVSFYQVDMTKTITTEIPIIIEGLAPAVKNNLGLLVNPRDHVTVHCLPGDLPSEFVINVDGLENVGDNITFEGLNLPKGVELSENENMTAPIVYIAAPQKAIVVEDEESEEGKAAEEAEGAEEASEKSEE